MSGLTREEVFAAAGTFWEDESFAVRFKPGADIVEVVPPDGEVLPPGKDSLPRGRPPTPVSAERFWRLWELAVAERSAS
jgi:hypothetical protein